MPDPTAVPDTYTPNTDLTWVQKATHIWALHPADAFKADKGGNPLRYATSADIGGGAEGVNAPTGEADNTLRLGGNAENGKWFLTTAPFICGDDPLTAGNQTPPVIGGAMMWVKLRNYAPANFAWFLGQASAAHSPAIGMTSGGLTVVYVNSLTFYGTAPPLDTWFLIGFQNNGTSRRLYINGVIVNSGANDSVDGYSLPFGIGCVNREGTPSYRIDGSVRLCAVINGANWTDAEVLEMYNRPFGYYVPALPPPPPNPALDYGVLHTELATDPEALGYAAPLAAGQYQAVAEMLNEIDPSGPKQPNRACPFFLFIDCVEPSEYDTYITWQLYTDLGFLANPSAVGVPDEIDFSRSNLVTHLTSKLAGTATLTALQVRAFVRDGSRAEVVMGTGVILTSQDIAYAWNYF